MLKSSIRIAMLAAVTAASAFSVSAQENILANKPIYTLGEPKTWTGGDQTYTFIVDDLQKLVAVPTNTANVYLYPENGAINTPESQAIGIQGFYIDMESSKQVYTVSTTWEGAAANALSIYVTDEVPTLDILNSPATFSASGLGQYTEKTFVLPEGVKGRYLVFQPTEPTNWGWGCKMRSISATAPEESVLTSFSVSPSFIPAGESAAVTYTFLNQFGVAMDADVTVEGGSLDGNVLTINGDYATFTASANGVEMQATVYAVNAPEIPAAASILAPVYTNYPEGYNYNDIDFNGTAGFITAYNGGAKELGRIRWANGEVAAAFGDTRCVFFYNNNGLIQGGWNTKINPSERGFGILHLDIFATRNLVGNVVFEGASVIGVNHEIVLQPGKWNSIDIALTGETDINNMSVRFDEANAGDIILSNIYFSTQLDANDHEAPVFDAVSVNPLAMGATFNLTATDNSATLVYYVIKIGDAAYSCSGKSGEEVIYTVSGLTPDTDYTASITVSDGVNVSEAKEVAFHTTALPVAADPTLPAEQVIAVFSSYYGAAELPAFNNWGSGAKAAPMTVGDKTVLSLYDYQGQWGGLEGFAVNNADLDIKALHIDILGAATDGELTLYPVWNDETGISVQAEGTHLVTAIKANEWNSLDFNLEDDFGYKEGTIFQFAMNGATIPNFAVDNFYFYTNDSTAISDVNIETAAEVNVFDMTGRCVRANVAAEKAVENLPAGLYIVGGRKVLVK